MPKLIGIDFGEKRIGVSVSDCDRMVSFPHSVILRESDEDAINKIAVLCASESIPEVVVGVPLGNEDEETEKSLRIRNFAKKLTEKTGLIVHFQDEAFSTTEVAALMPKNSKTGTDIVAAQIILKRYLESSGPC